MATPLPLHDPPRFLLSLAILALAIGARLILDPFLGASLTHATIPLAVVVTSWHCGTRYGVVTAILGYPAMEYIIVGSPLDRSLYYLLSSLGLYASLNFVLILFVRQLRQERNRLLRSNELLKATIENLSDGILVADTHGRVIKCNDAALLMHGLQGEVPSSRELKEILDFRTLDGVAIPFEQWPINRIVRGERLHKSELRVTRRDIDFDKTLQVSGRLVEGQEGSLAVVSLKDITESRRSDQTLRLLSKALESAANAIVVSNAVGEITWVNPAFTRLTGYEASEVIGRRTSMLKSGQQTPELYKDLWQTILRNEPWSGVLVNRKKDGTLYSEEMTITPVQADGERITHFIAIKQDISERQRAEDEIRTAKLAAERAKEEAEEANRAKDRFLATLSHELRTPLTPVLSAVQLLQRDTISRDKQQRYLEMIERNVLLEARLIDDLLDLTRIVQGKLVLERKTVSIGTIVDRVMEVCAPDAEAADLKLVLDLQNAKALFVKVDVTRIQQVFWNILKNSIKFTPSGGRISVKGWRSERGVVFSVTDGGIGIEPEALARIFNAFEQGDRRVTREFGGLGLGLAISKHLVEMHGGEISAMSDGAGKGATFSVTLPEAVGEEEVLAPVLLRSDPCHEPHKILLVEDNLDTAEMMGTVLGSLGYEIEMARSISNALAISESCEFDLVISDLGLPDGSGHELMREFRRRGVQVPSIAMSGFGREEDIEESLRSGFSVHLTKPVDFDTLVQKIGELS